MRSIVVSQPMFLPWIGLFQQIKLADLFIHYDDVQLPQGRSFCSRVQVKTENGWRWLTVPINHNGKQLIKDVQIDGSKNWKVSHLRILKECYRHAPHWKVASKLIDAIYAFDGDSLSEFCISGIEKTAALLGLESQFTRSSTYSLASSGSNKLLDLMLAEDGRKYITGHGAKHYLDHELFESNAIDVEYIDYIHRKYPQLNGSFTPYVSTIDLIANVGDKAPDFIIATSINWRDFCYE